MGLGKHTTPLRKKIMTTRIHPVSKLVRLPEISDLSGVPRNTLNQWRLRGHLPEPDYMVWDIPAWKMETIESFIDYCKKTGSAAGYRGENK